MENKIKIGFTIGDMNGIGPEVLIKSLSDNRILKYCTPIIYGSGKILAYYKKMLGADGFNYSNITSSENIHTKSVQIVNSIQEDFPIQPGTATENSAKAALLSLESATEDLMKKKIDALVTAPFDKSNMQKVGFKFAGHTEYINAKAVVSESVMMLMNDSLRVGLVTNHLPVKEIASSLSRQIILQKIQILNHSLKQDFAIFNPRIAVLALNPHSGDKGLLGDEEQNFITPAIKDAQEKKIIAIGPFAADGFFGSGNYKSFDAILAMYHDQGLVAYKALSFGNGINFTAGLPFIRTSPDHGTAFDIAGKNIASADSMLQAIFKATDICNNRKDYHESIKNPLKRTIVESERG